MKFSEEIFTYLHGQNFSSGLRIKIALPEWKIRMRIDYIENLVRNKNIIHVGCADHLPLIEQKIIKNTWLHKRLLQVAKHCIGIDIDSEAVMYLTRELHLPDIYCLDIVNDNIPQMIQSQKWDYLVLGELLEHLDDPIHFLKTIKEKYSKYVDKIIISAPNAFGIENSINIFKYYELNNTDHRFWFTPYTLAKIVTRAGLTVESFELCAGWKLGIHFFFRKILLRIFPAFRNKIVMIARLTD
jgi:2-polyprenyl-3-methyl-5-hydroxy-6-metoxy-1,4-benzoquinol methylase